MTTHTVKLKNRGTMTNVEINGLDVSRVVHGYHVRQEAGDHPMLELVLYAGGLEFDGSAKVAIEPELRAALIALGWTAPPE